MKKKTAAKNAFPLGFSLRSNHHNADLERKINKVFLYTIHLIHSFPSALKQESLFQEAPLIKHTLSFPGQEKG